MQWNCLYQVTGPYVQIHYHKTNLSNIQCMRRFMLCSQHYILKFKVTKCVQSVEADISDRNKNEFHSFFLCDGG